MNTKIIGITGGVGAGKSAVLNYIRDNYDCIIVTADDMGNEVKEPGGECYDRIVSLLGDDILTEDGHIDRKKMASKIYADDTLLDKVNSIIHPAVIDRIKRLGDEARKKGEIPYFFIEAALLIETGFNDYVDEMWYIYADMDVRRQRLKASRGYDDARIDGIMANQLSDEGYRAGSDVVIDNSGDLADTAKQIDKYLGGIGDNGRQR